MKKRHRRVTIEIGWWEDDKGFETGLRAVREAALLTGASVGVREDDISEFEVDR